MKYLIILIFMSLVGCQTTAGILSGAGEDLSRAGEWIKDKTDSQY